MDTASCGTPRWDGSDLLYQIGATLDAGRACGVCERGFVWPTAEPEAEIKVGVLEEVRENGAEQGAGQAGSRGSPARPRQGAAASCPTESTTAGAASSLVRQLEVSSELNPGKDAESQLVEALRISYPQFAVRNAAAGSWITGQLRPIIDLPVTVTMATLIPVLPDQSIQAWAWWPHGIWIGPRHTNFADGSICAFEQTDRTWERGGNLTTLLDLQAVWIARHIYLRVYDRWPGQQRLHTPYERLTEHRPGEFCGCGSDRRYELCCNKQDLEIGIVRARVDAKNKGVLRVRRPVIPGD
jgi:hypothetical protein